MTNAYESSAFQLTTGMDNVTGTLGDDSFMGTYNDAGTGSFDVSDVLDGGAGVDTLHITPIGVAAITPTDSYWSHVSNIEKIVIDTTGAGAQTITTGAFFEAAFAAAGVDLTTASNGGAITIDASTFSGAFSINSASGDGAQTITTGSGAGSVTAESSAGALTITSNGAGAVIVNAVSDAGAQTITTGAGLATVTAVSGAGAQVITGANLVSVTATSTGEGAQTITSTGASDVTVTASSGSGATTVVTGAGNDSITVIASAAAGENIISAGAGADRITLVTDGFAAPHTIVIGDADSALDLATADHIVGFNAASDVLKLGETGAAANYVEGSVAVTDFAQALTMANAALVGLAGAERYSFQWDATNGYLFDDTNGDGAADQVVVLVGVTDATFAAGNVIA